MDIAEASSPVEILATEKTVKLQAGCSMDNIIINIISPRDCTIQKIDKQLKSTCDS